MKPSVYHIHAGSLEMAVTNYGARVLSLMVPDKHGVPADVVVGYATLEEYETCPGERFFGAAVGRLANRLGGASFELDGKEYHTSANNNGNTLHGGFTGIDRVLWKVREVRPDAPTLCNLSHHTFFNLTGDASKTILDHVLRIDAQRYIPVDSKLIPTGEVRPVAGTPFDFRKAKPIGRDIEAAGGYDHNWCLAGEGLREAARLSEPVSGRVMAVYTDQPGIQFYSGNFFDGSYAGKEGRVIGHRCALALETQKWPDAIHHPGFPDTVLRPGETYSQTCSYKFSV